jgi:hypothetical protein
VWKSVLTALAKVSASGASLKENTEAVTLQNSADGAVSQSSVTRGPRIFLLGATPSLVSPGTLSPSPAQIDDSVEEKLRRTGGNAGNQVIAYGLLQGLKFEAVSWDHSIGPSRVTEEFDQIVIAAANFLHTGFDFGGMAEFINSTNLPCTMIGVGAQSKDYSTDIPLQPGTERLMRIVAERSKLIGARGPFSAEVLAKMGIHNVQVTGCPSYYMSASPDLIINKPELSAGSRLAINSSRDVVGHAFDRSHMIKVISAIFSSAIECNADFIAQTELPEMRIAETSDEAEIDRNVEIMLDQFPYFKQIAEPDIFRSWAGKHMRVYWDVAEWLAEMKKYDFVFGNRFHGGMVALQAGVPACVICHDTRTTEMCEFLGVPSISIREIEGINVGALYERVDPKAIQIRYRELYQDYKAFLRKNELESRLT